MAKTPEKAQVEEVNQAAEDEEGQESSQKTCFVIMPISDTTGYDAGHFNRVYEYIIRPACEKAGFEPIRADDVKSTNVIVIDILRKIISCDMAICDLSSNNPNVLYELGIRQSFDLPVSLIKDNITNRIFDIQSFRAESYDSSLRYDLVASAVKRIAQGLTDTYANKGKEVNSIIELLNIKKADLSEPVAISKEMGIILNAISNLSDKMSKFENKEQSFVLEPDFDTFTPDDHPYDIGDIVSHAKFGRGKVKGYTFSKSFGKTVRVLFDDSRLISVSLKDARLKPELPF